MDVSVEVEVSTAQLSVQGSLKPRLRAGPRPDFGRLAHLALLDKTPAANATRSPSTEHPYPRHSRHRLPPRPLVTVCARTDTCSLRCLAVVNYCAEFDFRSTQSQLVRYFELQLCCRRCGDKGRDLSRRVIVAVLIAGSWSTEE